MSGVQKYDQEKQLESTFEEIKSGFKKYDGLGNGDKQTVLLKELTNKMQECKKCAENILHQPASHLLLDLPDPPATPRNLEQLAHTRETCAA